MTKSWLRENMVNMASKEDQNADLTLCRTHRDCQTNTESPLLYSLRNHKPRVPVVCSMRDPLLSLFTNIARIMGELDLYLQDEEVRGGMIKNVLQNRLDVLSIPDEHRFVLPVDIERTKEQRTDVIHGFCDWCNVTPTHMTEDVAEYWAPYNSIKDVAAAGKDKVLKDSTEFEKLKELYNNRDIEALKEIFDREIAYLEKQEDAKKAFEAVGYKDLLWW